MLELILKPITLISLFTGSGVLIVLFSERFRRLARALIKTHFCGQKHDYRNEWLRFTERMAGCRTITGLCDAIASTYRETFGLRSACVFLLDREAGNFRGMTGACAERELAAASPLIRYIAGRQLIYDPFDREYIPSEREKMFIRETGASLIVPFNGNHAVEAFAVLQGHDMAAELTHEDYDLMKTFARQSAYAISNLMLHEELSYAREMESVGKISSFVMHDLKNLVSTISLVIDNARQYMNNPEFQRDTLQSLSGTVRKMRSLMTRLKDLNGGGMLNSSPSDLFEIISDTVAMINVGNVKVAGSSVIARVDPEEIQKVVLNLVLNAIEAVNGNGEVVVEAGLNHSAFIKVSDNGCGMTEHFIKNSLFKPFQTTKKKGLGIGLYQCSQIVNAHGGTIDVESREGRGSMFTIHLPSLKEVAHG